MLGITTMLAGKLKAGPDKYLPLKGIHFNIKMDPHKIAYNQKDGCAYALVELVSLGCQILKITPQGNLSTYRKNSIRRIYAVLIQGK